MHFANHRLLVTNETMVELVHDALLREWGRLSRSVKNDRDNLKLIEELREATRQWCINGKNESFLNHRGIKLETTIIISSNSRYHVGQIEHEYLKVCLSNWQEIKNSKELLAKTVETNEQNRLALARELHDDVLNAMAVLMMSL